VRRTILFAISRSSTTSISAGLMPAWLIQSLVRGRWQAAADWLASRACVPGEHDLTGHRALVHPLVTGAAFPMPSRHPHPRHERHLTARRAQRMLRSVVMRVCSLFAAWLTVALGISLGGLGCSTAKDPALPQVRSRAPKDLDCPGKELHVYHELGGRYRVTGCGRTTVYNTSCDQLKCSVGRAEEDTAPGWRDRPEPGSIEEGR